MQSRVPLGLGKFHVVVLVNNLLGKRLGYARGEDETTGDESAANLLMKETFSDTWICTNKIQSK